MKKKKQLAILIPCFNEEVTVGKVVNDFKTVCEGLEAYTTKIYVYDNNSTDKTAEIARKQGAVVVPEYQQGKGNVVRSMFRDIDADIYVMVDGDDTYSATDLPRLIEPVERGRADMVIADRLSSTYFAENKRLFHNFGNTLVRWLINFIFRSDLKDIMTGYRIFSKRFVKSMPVVSTGFEIETEMSAFALNSHLNVVQMPTAYKDRPEGSVSKLHTFRDGFRVLRLIFKLSLQYRPLVSYSILAIFALIFKLITHVGNYLPTGLFTAGLVLEGTKNYFDQLMEKENNRG